MRDYSELKPYVEQFKGPDGELYTVRSATADAGVQYRNASMAAAVLNPDGKITRWDGFANSEPVLVGCCVFRAGADAPVGEELIRKWPVEVMKDLHKLIVEKSPGLVEKSDPKEKPSGGGDS